MNTCFQSVGMSRPVSCAPTVFVMLGEVCGVCTCVHVYACVCVRVHV